jgi:oligopeptide transport system ATP-binding protein
MAADRPQEISTQPTNGECAMTTSRVRTPPELHDVKGPALSVKDLAIDIDTRNGLARAVDKVSFEVVSGQTMALLGESGCGKTMTANAIVGLLQPNCHVTAGSILIDGTDILTVSATQRRKLAGSALSIVFQDAIATLNPVYPVWKQLAEPFQIHQGLSAREGKRRAIELMERVGIPEPRRRADSYPHEFSGGLRQRLVIAAAVALQPRVVIADEPTTALDVTVQAQIMELLSDLRRENGMALVLITHDLAVVAEHADRVAVMYGGNVVETGAVADVFGKPQHPYTQGLLESIPGDAPRGARLHSIPGAPPELHTIPPGCVFQARCPHVADICVTARPTPRRTIHGTAAACHFAGESAS